MQQYAKAIGGALTALAVFCAGEFGLELPEEVTAALTTIFTAAVVWAVPNKPQEN
jgi:hypothetical protein